MNSNLLNQRTTHVYVQQFTSTIQVTACQILHVQVLVDPVGAFVTISSAMVSVTVLYLIMSLLMKVEKHLGYTVCLMNCCCIPLCNVSVHHLLSMCYLKLECKSPQVTRNTHATTYKNHAITYTNIVTSGLCLEIVLYGDFEMEWRQCIHVLVIV